MRLTVTFVVVSDKMRCPLLSAELFITVHTAVTVESDCCYYACISLHSIEDLAA